MSLSLWDEANWLPGSIDVPEPRARSKEDDAMGSDENDGPPRGSCKGEASYLAFQIDKLESSAFSDFKNMTGSSSK